MTPEKPMPDAPSNAAGPAVWSFLAALGRFLGWGLLCGVSGLILGFANGVVQAPRVEPNDPLAYEGYPVGVIFVMLLEGVLGFFFGGFFLAIVVTTPSVRTRSFSFVLAGAFLGIGLGWVLFPFLLHRNDASGLLPGVGFQAIGALGGLIAAALSMDKFKPSPIKPAGVLDDL